MDPATATQCLTCARPLKSDGVCLACFLVEAEEAPLDAEAAKLSLERPRFTGRGHLKRPREFRPRQGDDGRIGPDADAVVAGDIRIYGAGAGGRSHPRHRHCQRFLGSRHDALPTAFFLRSVKNNCLSVDYEERDYRLNRGVSPWSGQTRAQYRSNPQNAHPELPSFLYIGLE